MNTILKTLSALSAVSLLLGCSPADNSIGLAKISEASKYDKGVLRGWTTPHAGQLRHGAGFNFEGVPQLGAPGKLTIYIYNEKMQPVDLSGSKGARAAWVVGQSPSSCEMTAISGNAISCAANISDNVNLKLIAFINLPSGQVAQVDFDYLMDARPDEQKPEGGA